MICALALRPTPRPNMKLSSRSGIVSRADPAAPLIIANEPAVCCSAEWHFPKP